MKLKTFNDFIKDDSADSMMVFVIAAGVLVFGLVYLLLSYSFNMPIGAINNMIDSGMISQATNDHLSTMMDLWRASPFFFVIGLALWCFERSKGESVDSTAFFEYLILMQVTLVTSAYLVWCVGMSWDMIAYAIETNPTIGNYGPEFDVRGWVAILEVTMYYALMFPGFIGTILFTLHPILKQRQNDFLKNDEEGEFITNYSVDQM